jgi:protein-L-isoaspartate(D-aspartate) O-methyltransferase
MDLDKYGSHSTYQWTKENLYEVVLRGKKPILTSENLRQAFVDVDRKFFVPENLQQEAYADKELDIGFGQTINSPVLVAQMLQALDIEHGDKVLELGTGSGYSLALIAKAVGEEGFVYSVERNQQVTAIARQNMENYAELENYEVVFKDGSKGLPAKAPFAAIHITFAFKQIPEELLNQLKIGGRLVTPTTDTYIKLITRIAEDEYDEQTITANEFRKVQYGVE